MVIIGFTMFTNCKKEVKSEISKTKMEHKKKEVVYQVFTRLFGNTNPTNKPWGTIEENGLESLRILQKKH
jgi:hypothetical protein|tara:strand:- start:8921 stop:9130 length:210 start_codon:yes stop_codon:yes gene_type:complete